MRPGYSLKKVLLWGRANLLPWVLFVLLWEAVSRVSPVPSAIRILGLAWGNLTDPAFASALLGSLGRMAIGFTLVLLLGIGLGLLIGQSRALDDILGTLASALNAMPGAAWVPLAIFLFGLTEKAVIFTIVLGATGIVMVSTSSGIRDVPPLIIRAARTMGASGGALFWHVIVPAAIPRILDGLRLAWAFGWRALMAGELLVSTVRGMGQLMSQVSRERNIEMLLAYMVILALIGMTVDGIIFNRLIGARLRARWGTA